jgi:hypothetical protein
MGEGNGGQGLEIRARSLVDWEVVPLDGELDC